MIVPSIDLAEATDQEIIDAYVREGIDEKSARTYLAVLRNTDPRFVVD